MLVLTTASVYTCAWFYRHAKNLSRIDTEKRRPWLWILAPLIALAAPFAVGRLFRRFRAVGEALRVEPLPTAGAIGPLIFVILIAMHINDRLDGPVFATVVSIVCLAIAFALLTRRLNVVYDEIPDGRFKVPKYRFTWPSWVLTLVFGPIVAIGIGAGLLDDNNKYLRPRLPIGERAAIGNLPVYIVARDAWSLVSAGTNSDGSAEQELVGRIATSFGVIFKHGPDRTPELILNTRREAIYGSYDHADCEENRVLDGRTQFRRSSMKCEVVQPGNRMMWVVTVLEDDAGFYELFGAVEASKAKYAAATEALERLAAGFHHQRSSEPPP